MPGSRGSVAVGSPPRSGVPNHSFSLSELRKGAIAMSVTLRDSASDLEVSVSLKNSRAGHSIPSGLPERRLQLRVAVADDKGKVIGTAQQLYGRMLVDERGPAPFYAANRLQADTRIAAMETRQEQFKVAAPDQGTAEVTLVFIDIAPEIAGSLGIQPTEDVITRVSVPFGPRGSSGAHLRLPKTVEP
jgi:VCBS repeat-containing protein